MNVQRIRKSLVIAVMGLFLLPLLSACGGPASVNATLTEDYQIQLSKDTVKAGDITFHIKNDATDLNHEFVIVDSDLQAANLPLPRGRRAPCRSPPSHAGWSRGNPPRRPRCP